MNIGDKYLRFLASTKTDVRLRRATIVARR